MFNCVHSCTEPSKKFNPFQNFSTSLWISDLQDFFIRITNYNSFPVLNRV